MIVGEMTKEKIELEFIPLDDESFKEIEVDISEIISKEELIEKINTLEIKENEYIKIILTGSRNFEINKYEIIKFLENERIIKIKDNTEIAYNLEKLANDTTLKGMYAKEMQKKLKQKDITQEEKEIIEKAVEIGLTALQ